MWGMANKEKTDDFQRREVLFADDTLGEKGRGVGEVEEATAVKIFVRLPDFAMLLLFRQVMRPNYPVGNFFDVAGKKQSDLSR